MSLGLLEEIKSDEEQKDRGVDERVGHELIPKHCLPKTGPMGCYVDILVNPADKEYGGCISVRPDHVSFRSLSISKNSRPESTMHYHFKGSSAEKLDEAVSRLMSGINGQSVKIFGDLVFVHSLKERAGYQAVYLMNQFYRECGEREN